MTAATAQQVLDAARARGWRVASAESCTGGMLAAALTDIPGSSHMMDRGFVTYSNAAKVEMLGVRQATLDAYGAVSEEVAREMAQGARALSGADLTVSITGIAGPGGTDTKPEGRVCFAVASPSGCHSETVDFGALGRDGVRAASRDHALDLLYRAATKG
ncbi:nicotinamide-nucleotide amidase [Salinihabitans flavidus]|uniref:Nicotinamide-nucleotide amidase n=1 Tax=Salinihabitans flavidus TaxID=569882 RepID=A0A1H8NK46_9RHOB|nr:CinA family protein [Salinihabitans flavidus]SEO29798.1 nicotinamide-nucleotide amidase [Salinihabitans flavidus]